MLSCQESPLFFPNGMSVDSIHLCKTCKLRIVSKLSGPGNIIDVQTNVININENPMNSFIVNGVMYNLASTLLVFSGLHRLPGRSTVCPAELCLMFKPSQGGENNKGMVCLCLPIDTGNSKTSKYFSTITNYATGTRPTVGSLLTNSDTFLSYRGPSNFAPRTKTNPRPRQACDPVQTILTYYVCMSPISMDMADYNRLFGMLPKKGYVGPAEPVAELTKERCKLLTRDRKSVV